MEAEDLLESLAWALPFLALAGVFYALAYWKERKGRGLHAEAQQLLSSDQPEQAREILLKSLWKANETPALERRILVDLRELYRKAGVAFDPSDYELLVRQFEQLSKKGSHKAFSEMKEVQGLKAALIERLPALDGPATGPPGAASAPTTGT